MKDGHEIVFIGTLSDITTLPSYFTLSEVEQLKNTLEAMLIPSVPIFGVQTKVLYQVQRIQFIFTVLAAGKGRMIVVDGYPVTVGNRVIADLNKNAASLFRTDKYNLRVVYQYTPTEKIRDNDILIHLEDNKEKYIIDMRQDGWMDKLEIVPDILRPTRTLADTADISVGGLAMPTPTGVGH